MNLQDTLDALIGREGGYSNHPADKGGATMWGITEATARAYGYDKLMAGMPREVAVRIYMERYWLRPGLDKVNAIDPVIAEELLDTGVNMGPATAGKFLQRALNVLNQGGKLYADLTVDGAMGPMTLQALRAFLQLRGAAGRTVLMRMLNAQQSVRYMELAEANPSQEQFEFGWQSNRVGGL